jgi:LuxR family transcriptional regulator, maltose regulon positive regulatory protein
VRTALAALRLAQGDPHAAAAVLAPVLNGSAPLIRRTWLIESLLLEAIARDALGDPAASGRAVERALDLAEPEGAHLFFLLRPAPDLLERHARHRTAHASLIAEILDLLSGRRPARQPDGPQPPLEPLSKARSGSCASCRPTCRCRRSRTNCTSRTTPSEPTCATCTSSWGTHRRAEAVERARALGLLDPPHAGGSPHSLQSDSPR